MFNLKHKLAITLGAASLMTAPFILAQDGKSVTERLDALERIINARTQAQVDLSQHVDSLQGELSELRGFTEEQNYKLSQILERQRELYQELDKLSQAISTQKNTPTASNSNLPITSSSVGNTSVIPTISNPASPAATTFTSNTDENEMYDRAVNLVLKDKRYEQAIPEFKAFIKKYPNSVYLPNAHYWLGQLLFTKGDFNDSANSFNIVAEQYPDSGKRPDALFKLGMVALRMQKNALAKEKFLQVVKDYPDSTAAKLASARLSEL